MDVDKPTLSKIVAVLPDCKVDGMQRTTERVFGYDQCYAIPKGESALAFFVSDLGDPACYVLIRHGSGRGIKSAKQYIASFDLTVAAGTLVAGVVFKAKERVFFCVQDVLQYGGVVVAGFDRHARMGCIAPLFARLNPANYGATSISFGLPVSAPTYKALAKKIVTLVYDVNDVVYATSDWKTVKVRARKTTNSASAKSRHEPCVVRVVAYPDHDIYELVPHRAKSQRWAAVQTLGESRILNNHFRRIRENDDLDYTEMSGDEDTFEDVSEMKYIKRRTMVMECEYVSHLRKWRLLGPTDKQISDESVLQSAEAHSTR